MPRRLRLSTGGIDYHAVNRLVGRLKLTGPLLGAPLCSFYHDIDAREILKLIQPSGHRYYTYAPDLGLHGKWSLEDRLSGLEFLLERADQMSIIGFGAAEGVIARELLKRGAKKVHGFDLEAVRFNIANRVCAAWDDAEFRTEDISDWAAFRVANQDLLEESYDIVLYLGIYHRSRCQRDISENGLPETCDRDRILPSAIFDANRQPLSGQGAWG